MDKLARKVDIHHAAMQGSYFAGFSAIWGFGPVLLLYLGLSNSTLGVVTSLALVLPLLLQPALAALSDADSRWTSRRLALVLSLLTLAAAVVMTVSTGSKTVLVAAYAVIGVLLVSTSPFFNSMVMEYHLRGVNVNYGLGRGSWRRWCCRSSPSGRSAIRCRLFRRRRRKSRPRCWGCGRC